MGKHGLFKNEWAVKGAQNRCRDDAMSFIGQSMRFAYRPRL